MQKNRKTPELHKRTSVQILVSAGTDESVRIYNWAEKKESGQLHFHEGSVTCLASWRKQYLLTGSADTKVALWRMSDWSLVHVFRGHKGALLSLVVHPSDAQTFIRIVFRAGMRNPAVHGHVTSLPQCLGILFCMKFH